MFSPNSSFVRNRTTLFWVAACLLSIPAASSYLLGKSLFGFDPDAVITLISLAAALVLTVARWDWVCRFPTSTLGVSSMLLSPVAALVGMASHIDWLIGLSYFLLLVSFWSAQSDRVQGGQLGYLWPVLLGFLGLPAIVGRVVLEAYTPLLAKSLQSGLKFFQVPYTYYPSAIVFADTRIYLDEITLSLFSGLLFISLAGIYSACLRRNLVQSLMNIFLSLFTCALFQTGLYITQAVLHHRFQLDFSDRIAWITLLASWLLIAAIVFVSIERFTRGLLYPIADPFLPVEANPFAFLWNRLTKNKSVREKSSSSSEAESEQEVKGWSIAALPLLALLLFLGSAGMQLRLLTTGAGASKAKLMFGPGFRDVNSNVDSNVELDNRRAVRVATVTRGRCEADIWSYLSPLLAEEVSVFNVGLNSFEATSFAAARGWDTASAISLDDFEPADESSTDASSTMAELEPTTLIHTVYIDANGKILSTPEFTGELQNDVFTVHMIAQFRQPPTASQLKKCRNRFSEVVDRVSAL